MKTVGYAIIGIVFIHYLYKVIDWFSCPSDISLALCIPFSLIGSVFEYKFHEVVVILLSLILSILLIKLERK